MSLREFFETEIIPLRLLSKIPHRDVPPASKGTNPLERLTLSHTPSTNTGFRGERSLGKTLPRIGKRRATFRTNQATEEALLPLPCSGFLPLAPSQELGSL
jgi:hypothetical protein